MIGWLFDERYRRALNPATQAVPLLYFLYLCTVPLAKILGSLGIRPNTITTLSNLTAVAALLALIYLHTPWVFPLLWMLALFFDIADGIVARATGQSSAQGSFYDHMSDQLKVLGLFLALALRYQDQTVWILAFCLNGLFLFYGVVNQFSAVRQVRLRHAAAQAAPAEDAGHSAAPPAAARRGLKAFFARHPLLKKVVLGVYASIFVMYGNCMVLVLPVSFGRDWAVASMLFFGLVNFRSLMAVVRATMQINRDLAQAKVSWK